MTTLYELDQRIATLIENGFAVDEETGEVFFAEEDLEALEAARMQKLDGVACFIKSLNAEAAAIRAEEKALAARRRAKEAKAGRLCEYLAQSLQKAGESRFESARCVVSFRKSEAVEIMDESLLLPDYVSFKKVPNKAALKRALKNGAQLKGARLIVKQNIQVK